MEGKVIVVVCIFRKNINRILPGLKKKSHKDEASSDVSIEVENLKLTGFTPTPKERGGGHAFNDCKRFWIVYLDRDLKRTQSGEESSEKVFEEGAKSKGGHLDATLTSRPQMK